MLNSYELELLRTVRESDNLEYAITKAVKVITLFLEQPESSPTQSVSYPPALD